MLARLTQSPLTPQQQKFVTTGPVAALRAELRRWAAEPVGAAALLRHRDLRADQPAQRCLPVGPRLPKLDAFPIEGRRQLAERVDLHYRNRNLRIAVTEELINKLIPEREAEYADVDETVMGHPVRGESNCAPRWRYGCCPIRGGCAWHWKCRVRFRRTPGPTRVRPSFTTTARRTTSPENRWKST